jgi:hypothetical protein
VLCLSLSLSLSLFDLVIVALFLFLFSHHSKKRSSSASYAATLSLYTFSSLSVSAGVFESAADLSSGRSARIVKFLTLPDPTDAHEDQSIESIGITNGLVVWQTLDQTTAGMNMYSLSDVSHKFFSPYCRLNANSIVSSRSQRILVNTRERGEKEKGRKIFL